MKASYYHGWQARGYQEPLLGNPSYLWLFISKIYFVMLQQIQHTSLIWKLYCRNIPKCCAGTVRAEGKHTSAFTQEIKVCWRGHAPCLPRVTSWQTGKQPGPLRWAEKEQLRGTCFPAPCQKEHSALNGSCPQTAEVKGRALGPLPPARGRRPFATPI